MNVFANYARYYDLLYQDKNYDEEAGYLDGLIKKYHPSTETLLELGCGTGKHAIALTQYGYSVHGIDFSDDMLKEAEARHQMLPKEVASKLSFASGDVRNYRCDRQFDSILSLFHIISYQTTNKDLIDMMDTVKSHLKPGGLFIFDCWYGPTVLTDRPVVRCKELEDEAIKVTRIAQPKMYPNENCVDVNYSIIIKDKKTNQIDEVKETHKMRYLFAPEIEILLNQAGLELLDKQEWLTGNEPGFDTWGVCFIARKK